MPVIANGDASDLDHFQEVEKHLKEYGGPPKPLPFFLEGYLKHVAKCGRTICPWPLVKPAFVQKLSTAMSHMLELYPYDHLPAVPNTEQCAGTLFKERILEAAQQLPGAPFTIQRLCELLTSPEKHYKRSDKFLRALEKNIRVVTTVDPQGNREIYVDYFSGNSEQGTTQEAGDSSPSIASTLIWSRNASEVSTTGEVSPMLDSAFPLGPVTSNVQPIPPTTSTDLRSLLASSDTGVVSVVPQEWQEENRKEVRADTLLTIAGTSTLQPGPDSQTRPWIARTRNWLDSVEFDSSTEEKLSPSGTSQPLPSVETAFCSANRTLPLSQLTSTAMTYPDPDPAKESVHDQIGITLPASVRSHDTQRQSNEGLGSSAVTVPAAPVLFDSADLPESEPQVVATITRSEIAAPDSTIATVETTPLATAIFDTVPTTTSTDEAPVQETSETVPPSVGFAPPEHPETVPQIASEQPETPESETAPLSVQPGGLDTVPPSAFHETVPTVVETPGDTVSKMGTETAPDSVPVSIPETVPQSPPVESPLEPGLAKDSEAESEGTSVAGEVKTIPSEPLGENQEGMVVITNLLPTDTVPQNVPSEQHETVPGNMPYEHPESETVPEIPLEQLETVPEVSTAPEHLETAPKAASESPETVPKSASKSPETVPKTASEQPETAPQNEPDSDMVPAAGSGTGDVIMPESKDANAVLDTTPEKDTGAADTTAKEDTSHRAISTEPKPGFHRESSPGKENTPKKKKRASEASIDPSQGAEPTTTLLQTTETGKKRSSAEMAESDNPQAEEAGSVAKMARFAAFMESEASDEEKSDQEKLEQGKEADTTDTIEKTDIELPNLSGTQGGESTENPETGPQAEIPETSPDKAKSSFEMDSLIGGEEK